MCWIGSINHPLCSFLLIVWYIVYQVYKLNLRSTESPEYIYHQSINYHQSSTSLDKKLVLAANTDTRSNETWMGVPEKNVNMLSISRIWRSLILEPPNQPSRTSPYRYVLESKLFRETNSRYLEWVVCIMLSVCSWNQDQDVCLLEAMEPVSVWTCSSILTWCSVWRCPIGATC